MNLDFEIKCTWVEVLAAGLPGCVTLGQISKPNLLRQKMRLIIDVLDLASGLHPTT